MGKFLRLSYSSLNIVSLPYNMDIPFSFITKHFCHYLNFWSSSLFCYFIKTHMRYKYMPVYTQSGSCVGKVLEIHVLYRKHLL